MSKVPSLLYGGGDETYVGMLLAIAQNINKIKSNDVSLILDFTLDDFIKIMISDEYMEFTNKQNGGYYYKKYKLQNKTYTTK
jgi:hypothetical protein